MNPIDDIIPRKQEKQLQEILDMFSDYIEELVNMGSNILKWDIEKSTRIEDKTAYLFLRAFIEQIDAISILVRNSSIEPCRGILRTALEIFFSLEYLLEKNTEKRSKAFIVWFCQNKIKETQRHDGKSDLYKNLFALYKKDKLYKDIEPPVYDNADKIIKDFENDINSQYYKEAKDEYEKTKNKFKQRNKTKFDWFSQSEGPESILKLAEHLNHYVYYHEFYSIHSENVHGTYVMKGGFMNNDNFIGIRQIRNARESQLISQHCFKLCLRVFTKYVLKRTPSQKDQFKKWYMQIKPIYMDINSKVYIK